MDMWKLGRTKAKRKTDNHYGHNERRKHKMIIECTEFQKRQIMDAIKEYECCLFPGDEDCVLAEPDGILCEDCFEEKIWWRIIE